MDARRLRQRLLRVIAWVIVLSAVAGFTYGEESEEPATGSFGGLYGEGGTTPGRSLANLGFWLTVEGKIVHAGLFVEKPNREQGIYGVDVGAGYLASSFFLWPFVELGAKVGVKIGEIQGVDNLVGELYPKVGIALPLSKQVLFYAGYLYSFTTQGRKDDYGVASAGLVWAL